MCVCAWGERVCAWVCVCVCVGVYERDTHHHALKIQSASPSEGSKNCQGLATQVGSNESALSPGAIVCSMPWIGPTHRRFYLFLSIREFLYWWTGNSLCGTGVNTGLEIKQLWYQSDSCVKSGITGVSKPRRIWACWTAKAISGGCCMLWICEWKPPLVLGTRLEAVF